MSEVHLYPVGPNSEIPHKMAPIAILMYRGYRGTSLTRTHNPLGPYRRPMPRVLGGSLGGSCFLMGEVSLYRGYSKSKDTKRPYDALGGVLCSWDYRGTSLIRNRHPP